MKGGRGQKSGRKGSITVAKRRADAHPVHNNVCATTNNA